jgi:hypothetical protein
MNKTLILAIALSLVLVSGTMFSAQADCCWHFPNLCSCFNWNPCNWHWGCGCQQQPTSNSQDMNKPLTNAPQNTVPAN